jgi:hypothetical protein
MNDVQKAKLVEIRRLLDEALTDLVRQEQDVLLLRTPS